MPPVGLAFLASSVRKAGFTCKIIDCALRFDTLDASTILKTMDWLHSELSLANPRLAIGIGPCTTSSIRSIVAIADLCKEKHSSTPLIFGGPLALVPDQGWLFFRRLNAFAVVKGDGEHPLVRVLTALQQGTTISHIPGVQAAEDQDTTPYFEKNLDECPSPAWDMLEILSYKPSIRRDLFVEPVASILGSRGCPYRCAFCLSGLVKYRKHSYQYVAEQAAILQRQYGIRALIFYDDCFFPDHSRANDEISSFVELLSHWAPGLLWQIEIRPDVFCAISDETLRQMFSGGCRQINLGIEKGNRSQLELLCKPFDIPTLIANCQSVKRVCPGMRLTGTFILGGPGETSSTIQETLDLSTQLGLLFAHFYPLELYPGTVFYDSVFHKDMRAWFDRIMNDALPWGEIVYQDTQISSARLVDLVCSAYRNFYDRDEWRDLARKQLGANYEKVLTITKSWQHDRFLLTRGDPR